MLIAKLDNQNKIVKIADYREFGGFEDIPSDEDLKESGFRKVNQWRKHSSKTQKLVPSEPSLEEPWVYTVKVEDLSEEEVLLKIKQEKTEIKRLRNILLAESDWIYLPDASISDPEKTAWIEYRKKVKEVASIAETVKEVIWPDKPQR